MPKFRDLDDATKRAMRDVLDLPGAGTWNPSLLATPPQVWFDAKRELDLIDFSSPTGGIVTKLRSLYNASSYEGTPSGPVTTNNANAVFGGNRSIKLHASGDNNILLAGTGALGISNNKPGVTLIMLMRWLDSQETSSGTEGYCLSMSGASASTSRAAIGRSQSAPCGFRYGGRRLDANSFDGGDVGGSAGRKGIGPQLVIATFNTPAATKNFRCWGNVDDTDATYQTAGNIGPTNSAATCIGAFQAVGGVSTAFEFCVAAIADCVYSTADLERIEGYIAHTYGLAHCLIASHPYRNAPPDA